MAYLDYLDLAVPTTPSTADASWTLSAYRRLLPALRGVEYLVVTHPLFRAQADRVAAAQGRRGPARPSSSRPTTAYDRFSGGIVEPRAIQALIRHAFADERRPALRPPRRGRHLRPPRPRRNRLDELRPHPLRPRLQLGPRPLRDPLRRRRRRRTTRPRHRTAARCTPPPRPTPSSTRSPPRTPPSRPCGGAQLVVSDNASETDSPFRNDAENALRLLPQSRDVRWSDLAQGPAAPAPPSSRAGTTGCSSPTTSATAASPSGPTSRSSPATTSTPSATPGSPPCSSPGPASPSGTSASTDPRSTRPSSSSPAVEQSPASDPPASPPPPARPSSSAPSTRSSLSPGSPSGRPSGTRRAGALDVEPNASEVIEGFHLFGDPCPAVIPWPRGCATVGGWRASTSWRSAPTPTTWSWSWAGRSPARRLAGGASPILDLTQGESGSRGTPETRVDRGAGGGAGPGRRPPGVADPARRATGGRPRPARPGARGRPSPAARGWSSPSTGSSATRTTPRRAASSTTPASSPDCATTRPELGAGVAAPEDRLRGDDDRGDGGHARPSWWTSRPSGKRSYGRSRPTRASGRHPRERRGSCRWTCSGSGWSWRGDDTAQRIGVKYGEGFVTREPLVVDDLLALGGGSL